MKPKTKITVKTKNAEYSLTSGVSVVPSHVAYSVLYSLFYDVPYPDVFDSFSDIERITIEMADSVYDITNSMLYVPESMPRIQHSLSALLITPLDYAVIKDGKWSQAPICSIMPYSSPNARYEHILRTYLDQVDVAFIIGVKVPSTLAVKNDKMVIIGE